MYPLHDATAANNLERVLELIGAGQDPNGLNEDELTPLQILCGMGSGNALIAEMLIMAGADPNCFDPLKRRTALHEAVRSDNVPLVRELLRYNVKIHSHDVNGVYIFTYACETGNRDIVQALLEKGANVNEVSQRGYTPLLAATVYDRPWIVEMLLDAGAVINAQNGLGNTALHVAAFNKYENVRDLLLDRGANPQIQNLEGRVAIEPPQ
jgi:ankyrin repeat protein